MFVDNFFHLQKQSIYLKTSRLPRQFLKHNRNKVALNLFLAGMLLAHDLGGAIVFISVNSEVKCNTTDVSGKGLHIRRT